MRSGILVAVMASVTIFLRALPFWIFKNKTPEYITYLGKVLPSAIIGMLVVYCLRDTKVFTSPYGLPELVAGLIVAGLQVWKKNSLLSILCGTVVYMFFVSRVAVP